MELSAAIRSKAAREACLAVEGSVEYKTILNGLAMCVSSNSKRASGFSGVSPCSGPAPARIGHTSHSAATGITFLRQLNERGQYSIMRRHRPRNATRSIPNVSSPSHAVHLALSALVLGIVMTPAIPSAAQE